MRRTKIGKNVATAAGDLRDRSPGPFTAKTVRVSSKIELSFQQFTRSRLVYNEFVARGWESKSVESQMESAERLPKHPAGNPLNKLQLETERKRDSLLLHRTRVLRDLENCHEDRYRKTLNQGLTYLEDQLAALGWKASEPNHFSSTA
jgi:hypothetical protein